MGLRGGAAAPPPPLFSLDHTPHGRQRTRTARPSGAVGGPDRTAVRRMLDRMEEEGSHRPPVGRPEGLALTPRWSESSTAQNGFGPPLGGPGGNACFATKPGGTL